MNLYSMKFAVTKKLPFGRVQEYLNTLDDDQKQRTGTLHGKRLGEDTTVKTFKTRQALAKAIRKDQKTNKPTWFPVVPLNDHEGY